MKTTTYAKLSKFVGKPSNYITDSELEESNFDYSVTEFTENKIFEYATNRLIAYRTIQNNYTEIKDGKIFNNLKGIKNVSKQQYQNIHKLFDSKYDNKGKRDDIPGLVKEFIKAKSVSDETFHFVLGEKEFSFNTKTVSPAFDFVKSLMNDKTEIDFNDNNFKLEYDSEFKFLKITFFCLNGLVVQVLIAPVYNR